MSGTKQHSIQIGDKRQSVRLSPLYQSSEDLGFQLEARTAVETYFHECHSQDDQQPTEFGGMVEHLAGLYETSKTEVIQYCIAWHRGWSERES